MRSIPLKDKKILIEKKQVCSRCGKTPTQWHHPFIYAGKQITDHFATAFACKDCHERATPHNNKYIQEVREFFELAILKQSIGLLIQNYPRNAWLQHLIYLNRKYEVNLLRSPSISKPNLQERKRDIYLPKPKS